MTYKTIVVSALLALGLTGGALAATGMAEPAEIKTLDLVKVTAGDAVAAVEASSGGQVVEFSLVDQNGQPAYQVSVIKSDGSELTFLVDGMSGTVSPATDMADSGTGDAAATADASETGESAGDEDSANEDAN